MRASTVGDELRRATNDRAKVIGISDKPRAAILPAGRHANAAYWLSSSSGSVISTDYYFPQLPDWVREFNSTHPLDKYFGARWDRLLPEADYLKRAGADSPPWENIGNVPGDTNAFPHIVTGGAEKPNTAFYAALDHSPFVNDVLVSLAERTIEKEQLGARDDTDILTVSLSGNDHVGHRFGPYSQEVMDITLRVDRQIATLLDFVDARVGLKNSIVVLTSDHGVAPLLDQSATRGISPVRIGNATVITAIRSAIRERYGAHAPGADYILKYKDGGVTKDAILNGNIYFNLAALKRDGVALDEISQIAAKAVLNVPGIARAFTRSRIESCRASVPACVDCPVRSTQNSMTSEVHAQVGKQECAEFRDPVGGRVVRGFDPDLSGDVVVIPKPFVYLGDSIDPANHGSPYEYDTHVPVIIMGKAFKRGRYNNALTPLDIAPTLSAVLGIPAPDKSQASYGKRCFQVPLSQPR